MRSVSGKYFLKKLFAGAATIALGTSFASIGAPQAHAAIATKTAPLSCRTNGAPMGYNVTRDMHTRLVVSGPDHVKAGHNTVVRVQYLPDAAPGTESIATMETLQDIVVRFTLNDPRSFVTARAVNAGQNLTKQPQISLVGGNTLVLSGMTVNVNGKDTHWAPPSLELTFTAPTDGDPLKTLHLAVEGAAGKFNNPANAMTMRARTRSELGETTVQMNCQARSDASSVLTIPVTGAKDSSSTPVSDNIAGTSHKGDGTATGKDGNNSSEHGATSKNGGKGTANTHDTSGGKGDGTGTGDAQVHGPGTTSGDTATTHTSASTSNGTTTAADGLQRLDSDVYAEDVTPVSKKAPTWLTALISVLAVGAVGAVAYKLYQNYRDRDDD